jgi:hypothetical protein
MVYFFMVEETSASPDESLPIRERCARASGEDELLNVADSCGRGYMDDERMRVRR